MSKIRNREARQVMVDGKVSNARSNVSASDVLLPKRRKSNLGVRPSLATLPVYVFANRLPLKGGAEIFWLAKFGAS